MCGILRFFLGLNYIGDNFILNPLAPKSTARYARIRLAIGDDDVFLCHTFIGAGDDQRTGTEYEQRNTNDRHFVQRHDDGRRQLSSGHGPVVFQTNTTGNRGQTACRVSFVSGRNSVRIGDRRRVQGRVRTTGKNTRNTERPC